MASIPRLLLFFSVTAVLCKVSDGATSQEDITRLQNDLLVTYSSNWHPQSPNSSTVPVIMTLSLLQISKVDTVDNTISIIAEISQSWKDERLKWSPEQQGGLKKMMLLSRLLWIPPVILRNGRAVKTQDDSRNMVDVNYNGTVDYYTTEHLTVSCNFDLTHFPFDEQVCKLYFFAEYGPLIQLNVRGDGFHMINYIEDVFSPWILTNRSSYQAVYWYECCHDDKYTDLHFTLRLKRNGNHFIAAHVLPAVVVALVTSLLFLMPTVHNQKFIYGCCQMVVLVVLMCRSEMGMPAVMGSTPLLIQFYIASLVLMALSLLCTCFTANMMTCSITDCKPPQLLTRVMAVLGRVLCVHHVSDKAKKEEEKQTEDVEAAEMKAPDTSTPARQEWGHVAVVFDRLFFIIYIALIILFCVVMLRG